MASIRERKWQHETKTKRAWVADYFDQSGKRHIKTFRLKKDANDWLVTAQNQVAQGTHTPESSSTTVSRAAQLWLDRGELEGLEQSTLRQYRNHVDLHINPLIGQERLARLTAPMIENFRDAMIRKAGRPMARKVLTSLKSIIGEAHRRGLISHNPTASVRIDIKKRENPKPTIGNDVPSKQEINNLLTHANGRWRPFFITAIFTGMRASELRGLTWSDVDFKRNTVHVRQRATLWGEIGAPKSAAGDRLIPLSPMVTNALREWKLACPKGPLDLVFPNGKGRVENHANIVNRGFDPLQVAASVVDKDGKPKYSLHSLRHFCASWLIEQGFSPKRLQTLLGHSSITMTFDTYGHLFPSLEDDHAKLAAGEAALIG